MQVKLINKILDKLTKDLQNPEEKMGTWYKLDTAGRIFPAVASSYNTSIFRISMLLTEPVRQELLQEAADTVIKRFPTLAVKLRRGVFWSFLGENSNKLIVKEDDQYPCYRIRAYLNNGYLLRVLYYNCRISVEVFHSLTDGNGAIELLKALVYQYLKLCGKKVDPEGIILLPDEVPDSSETEDSYEKYYKPVKSAGLNKGMAFHIKGTPIRPFGNNVVHGIISASGLNAVAKDNGATITEYLAAALIYSIYTGAVKGKSCNEPVVVAIPVNLRKIFPSVTLRNFFTVVNIGIKVTEKDTFDSILKNVSTQLREKTVKDNLYGEIAKHIKIEKMIVARFVPMFIKNIAMKYGYEIFNERGKTITLSNLGNIKLPESMQKCVDRMDSIIYPTKKSLVNCCMCSVNDKLTVTFSRTIIEADVIRNFFSFLGKQPGLRVEIYTNNWGIKNA